jgi:hypothetical protein
MKEPGRPMRGKVRAVVFRDPDTYVFCFPQAVGFISPK